MQVHRDDFDPCAWYSCKGVRDDQQNSAEGGWRWQAIRRVAVTPVPARTKLSTAWTPTAKRCVALRKIRRPVHSLTMLKQFQRLTVPISRTARRAENALSRRQ